MLPVLQVERIQTIRSDTPAPLLLPTPPIIVAPGRGLGLRLLRLRLYL